MGIRSVRNVPNSILGVLGPIRSCTEPKQDEHAEIPEASGRCLHVQALGSGRKRSNMRGKPKTKYDGRVSDSTDTRLGK